MSAQPFARTAHASLALLSITASAAAQCPDFDLSFAAPRTDAIHALTVFDDGSGPRLVAGAEYPALAGWDGERWTVLGGGVDGRVNALLVHDFGSGPELVVAGNFLHAGGLPFSNIARFDGTSWSALGQGFDSAVHGLALFDAGSGPRVVATGAFTNSGGTPLARIATFVGGAWLPLGSGLDAPGHALATFDAGAGNRLVAGGEFVQAGGAPASFVAQWNGSAWSQLGGGGGGGVDGEVHSLLAFGAAGSQSIVAGGNFQNAGGSAASLIARFDGSVWSGFGPGLDPDDVFNGTVDALMPDGNGFVAAGRFQTFAPPGSVSTNVARWNGSSWEPLATGVGVPLYIGVEALGRYDAGDGQGAGIFAAGSFSPQTGQPNSIARWNGASWTALRDDGARGLIHDAGQLGALSAEMWQGELVIAGEFYGAGSAPDAYGIARFDGTRWHSFGDSPARGYLDHPRVVRSLDLGSGPELVLGMSRYFSHDARVPVYRWNGAAWLPFENGALPAETISQVLDVAVFDGGSGPALFAGGSALRPSGTSVPDSVARWNGSTWTALGAGGNAALDGSVIRLLAFDDGAGSALYAGGMMTGAIARYDGAAWSVVGTGFTSAGGTNAFVADLVAFDDGAGAKLYAGGAFVSAGGVSTPGVARWNGVAWEAVPGVPAGFVGISSFAVFDDGHGRRLCAQDLGDDLWAFDGSSWERVGFTEPYFTGARISAFSDLPGGLPGASGLVVHGNFREVFEVGAPPAAISGLTIFRGCPRVTSFCAGDGSGSLGAACPCGNQGLPARGCENSASTGGALLVSTGTPSLSADTLVLNSSGERPTTLSIFLQGNAQIASTNYGDGLRCTGGALKRLYTRNAVAGSVTAPIAGDPSISARSATLGSVIAPEATRFYQVYYRDPIASFCPSPTGGTFNVSNGLKIIWGF